MKPRQSRQSVLFWFASYSPLDLFALLTRWRPGWFHRWNQMACSGVLLHYAHRGIAVERDGYVAPASKGANFIDYCQPRGSFWAFRTQVLIAHW
jgi:hypothetical protein